LGFGHEASAEALQCIGLVLREEGEFEEAIAMMGKSLSVRKSRLGEESPLVAETQIHLSSCYFKLRKVDEATVASNEALRITAKVLDPDHILHSNSLKSVADLQQAKGNFGEALQGYDEVLRIKERWLGDSHLECADTYNNVGNAKFKQGDFQGAEEAFTKVSKKGRRKKSVRRRRASNETIVLMFFLISFLRNCASPLFIGAEN